MNALERNRYSDAWSALGAELPLPRAILVVSAHWYVRGVAVTAGERPRTIHDFYGFPRDLYAIRYDAPGDPQLAGRLAEMLGTLDVTLDDSWGLDHGAWSVLVHMYPDAEIPVLQLALDATRAPDFHWAIGAALAPLRDDGVLVLGSGNVVHNLKVMDPYSGPFDWAAAFRRAHSHRDRSQRSGSAGASGSASRRCARRAVAGSLPAAAVRVRAANARRAGDHRRRRNGSRVAIDAFDTRRLSGV